MADYGEFNNNNYLPGQYNDMDAGLNYHTAMAQTRSSGTGQNSFTFTSPTQCITLATYRPCIQTTSPISSLSAPGVGTSWQHSIPVTMPWVEVAPHLPQPGVATTVFTGAPASHHLDDQLSFRAPLRRPKRKALQLPDEAPTSKVYLCADQFANLKISPCEKQIYGLPTDEGGNTGIQFYSGASTGKSRSDNDGWQRFRDVENRLDVEVDDDVDLSMGVPSDNNEGPFLKVAKGVLDPSVTNSSILPRRVMEDITRPCMQIVLWKSPGEIIRDLAVEEIKPSGSTSCSTTISKSTDTSKMDTFERSPLTSRDNIMDTCLESPILDSTSNSHFQPSPSSSYGRFSAIDILTPPVLSDIVQHASSSCDNRSSSSVPFSSSSSGQVDLDMFDSLDDFMQL